MEFSKNLKNFLSVLVKKKRIFFLKKIILSFLKLSSIKRGELNAKLISSKDLSSKELKNVSSELSKTTGSEISFDYQVDKDLIGGFKMQIGSLMIDTSIKNKLKKYKQIMLEN
jgi:F-type H+-transporting ATPase subunit delta